MAKFSRQSKSVPIIEQIFWFSEKNSTRLDPTAVEDEPNDRLNRNVKPTEGTAVCATEFGVQQAESEIGRSIDKTSILSFVNRS